MSDKIIEKLLVYLESTEDFILEQVPDIIQQTLRYEKISTIYYSILMIIIAIIGAIFLCHFLKNPRISQYGSWEVETFVGVLITAILSPICFIQFCCCVDKFIKLQIAPKYYLISLFMDLKKD